MELGEVCVCTGGASCLIAHDGCFGLALLAPVDHRFGDWSADLHIREYSLKFPKISSPRFTSHPVNDPPFLACPPAQLVHCPVVLHCAILRGRAHKEVTNAVHQNDGKICMQVWYGIMRERFFSNNETRRHQEYCRYGIYSQRLRRLVHGCSFQVLHAGRYAYHPWAVAPSAEKAPINKHTPEALSNMDVHYTVRDFVR